MSQLWGAFWCLQILWLLSKKNPGGFFLQIWKQNYQHVHKFSTLLIVPDSQKSSVQIILQLVFHKQTEKSSSKCCKSRNLCYKKVFFHNDSKKKKLPRRPCSTAPGCGPEPALVSAHSRQPAVCNTLPKPLCSPAGNLPEKQHWQHDSVF